MSYTLGIDPGLTGAIAFMDDDRLVSVVDMPTCPKIHGKGNQIDCTALWSLVSIYQGDDPSMTRGVVIERQSPMPKQGVVSVFSLGDSVGVLRALVAAAGIPLTWTRPATWKRAAGLLGRDKLASLTLARELWPEHADRFARKLDHGRAEAALIARFG